METLGAPKASQERPKRTKGHENEAKRIPRTPQERPKISEEGLTTQICRPLPVAAAPSGFSLFDSPLGENL